jgi:hypothetical protein
MARIVLPGPHGSRPHRLSPPPDLPSSPAPSRSRIAYAAAHVVAAPQGDNAPGAPAAVDWDATIAFRGRLWGLGLGRGRRHGHRAAGDGPGLAGHP